MYWNNGQEGRNRKWAKLDRALVNIQFVNQFCSARLEYLMRRTSDHKPMLIHFSNRNRGYGF